MKIKRLSQIWSFPFLMLSHSPFSPCTSKWWQILVLITPAAAFMIFISYLSILRPSNLTNCIPFICSLMTLWLTCCYKRVKLETTSVGFKGGSFIREYWWIWVLSAKFESEIFSGSMLWQALFRFFIPRTELRILSAHHAFWNNKQIQMRPSDREPHSPLPTPSSEYCYIKNLAFQSQQRHTADTKDHLNGINVNEHFHSQTLKVPCMWFNQVYL